MDDKGNPHVCQMCATVGSTCCQYASDDIVAPLSESEIRVICRALPQLAEHRFVELAPNTAAFLGEISRLFPLASRHEIEQAFPPEGHHFRLTVGQDNSCVLLGSSGCLLRRECRPLFCRLYPVWFSGQQLQVFGNDQCYALADVRTVDALCDHLGTSPVLLAALHSELCQAWGMSPLSVC